MTPQLIDVALRCANVGWWVFPLGVKSKVTDSTLAPHSHKSASNDPEQIKKWWTASPGANIGIDLGRSGLTVLDFDNGLPPVELGLSDKFQVSTSRGTHVYFVGVSKQGDMYFNGQQVGEVKSDGGYILSPFSVHPDGSVYTMMVQTDITPPPDGLIERLRPERKSSPNIEGEKIPRGQHDTELTRIAGKLRQAGAEEEAIYTALVEVCEKRCENYGNDYRDMCRKISHSVCRYPVGQDTNLELTQVSTPVVVEPEVLPEIDTSTGAVRPVFPDWVMEETSLFINLVEPTVKTSSKHAEFIFVPAVQMMMNYLSGQVTIGGQRRDLNMFVGLISPYGQFFKSSSCVLGQDYFKLVGTLMTAQRDTKESNGKVVIAQAGSPEGFGLKISKLNPGVGVSRAILFNDELGKFVSKAGIESSAFTSDLLGWYNAADFGNSVTSTKNNFHFDAHSYCFGWQWCTTDRGFNRHWPKLAGLASGLEDRTFFVISPAVPKPTMPYRDPMMAHVAGCTRQVIHAAIKQGNFEFWDFKAYADMVMGMDPRSMELVETLSLYFTIDLGRTVIDKDEVTRAIDLVDYRNQTTRFLAPIEADNQQGRLQKEIIRELRQHRGKMRYRDLCRNLDFERYGSDVWKRAYFTMLPDKHDEGIIFEFQEQTTAGKRTTRMVGLVKFDD